jgi:NADPH-dependent 2,4-dienoyl-CoA reductase/sulfur reductase-like enzyme
MRRTALGKAGASSGRYEERNRGRPPIGEEPSVSGSHPSIAHPAYHGHAPERREVVVVGGSQAGLAIGYFLAQQGRDFTILDAAGELAATWRERWESLHLFTSARYDALPGLAFPGDPDRYPSKDEVADYPD